MQSDEGIEHEESRSVTPDCFCQATLITFGVEPERALDDKMERYPLEVLAAVKSKSLQTRAHALGLVLRGEDQHRAWRLHLILPQRRGPCGDAESEIERKPALTRLRRTAEDPDAFFFPELFDEPADSIATGELDGSRYGHVLRAGEPVAIDGIGERYGGVYYVDKVSHRFTVDGYRQSFELMRNAYGDNLDDLPGLGALGAVM